MITFAANTEYVYGQTFRLKPIFDVHLLNKYCDEGAFIKWLSDADDNTYFIGGGDLMDSIVVTDPRYRKSSDGSNGDGVIDEQVNRAVELLEPYRGRILGLGTGNHEDMVTKKSGTNPMLRVCEKLGVPFLGFSWLFKWRFREKTGRGRTLTIRGHHGWGGGSRTQGADITKYSKDVMMWEADLFLYGHVHKKQADRVPRLSMVGDELRANPKTMVLCGTFLKTYSNTTDPTYSEIKGYPPVEIGGVDISVRPLATAGVRVEVAI